MASSPIASKANTEGYPFVCVETITNSAEFTCYAGDQGSIVEYDESTKRAKVQIPRRGERGWVKITHLHVGRSRKYGDVTVDTGFSPQITASPHNEGIASDDFESILWTMMEYPDRWVYYRSPYQASPGAGVNVLFTKDVLTHDNKETVFEIRRGGDHPLPPTGASIHFSVEIMKSGRHSLAFSRLPDLGIWDNWSDANKIALHTRWKEGDQWYSFYLQHDQDYLRVQDPTELGSIGVYMDMINFRNYLERKTFTTPLPWATVWGIARVKQIHYDFLNQTIRLIDPPTPSPPIVPTPIRMEVKLRADYEALGIINYGKLKTDPSIDFHALNRPRAKICDICYILSTRHEYHPEGYNGPGDHSAAGPCITEGGNQSCTHCHSWGHKCTFSNLDKQKALALSWYPPRPHVAKKIADPGFRTGTLAS